MSLPGAAPLEALSSGEPREAVGALVSDLARLRAEVEAAHPDLDRPHLARHSFTLTAVRF